MAPANWRTQKDGSRYTGFKLNNMQIAQIIGLIAGTITSITFLPQVIRIWKTRSAKDLSMLMMIMLIVGTSLWLSYGLMIKDAAIIYTNSMVLAMSMIMMYFKLRFK